MAGPCGPEPWYIEVGADEDPVEVVSRLSRNLLGEPLLVHSTSWRCARGSVILSFLADLRRIRPQVVLTLQPEPANPSLGHLATTAVLLAADVRFGHTCTTRGPHTVSKLCYLTPSTGKWYSVLSTVQPGATNDDDLFAGLRRPTPMLEYLA